MTHEPLMTHVIWAFSDDKWRWSGDGEHCFWNVDGFWLTKAGKKKGGGQKKEKEKKGREKICPWVTAQELFPLVCVCVHVCICLCGVCMLGEGRCCKAQPAPFLRSSWPGTKLQFQEENHKVHLSKHPMANPPLNPQSDYNSKVKVQIGNLRHPAENR